MGRALLLDSFNICARARYGLPDMRFGQKYTGAIYGYMRDMMVMANTLECDHIVPCWDSGNDYRYSVFPDYKAKRRADRKANETPKDKEAFHTFLELKESILEELGFRNVIYSSGFECDDVMAALVLRYEELWGEMPIMVTTDEDMYQCLRDCMIWNPAKQLMITEESFRKEYGFPPEMWVLVKTAGGCSTDEVPSVKKRSIGEGSAVKWVSGELSGKKLDRINCEEGVSVRERNLNLVAIPCGGTCVPAEMAKDELSLEKYAAVCERYGFRSLMAEPYISYWKRLVEKQNA